VNSFSLLLTATAYCKLGYPTSKISFQYVFMNFSL